MLEVKCKWVPYNWVPYKTFIPVCPFRLERFRGAHGSAASSALDLYADGYGASVLRQLGHWCDEVDPAPGMDEGVAGPDVSSEG